MFSRLIECGVIYFGAVDLHGFADTVCTTEVVRTTNTVYRMVVISHSCLDQCQMHFFNYPQVVL